MLSELSRLASFNPDIDEWYSCHTSDDEAYQEALERNSVASFYTARGAASSTASIVYTSIALGSPSRLADADQALAEMVLESIGDPRPQHDPPELDKDDAPVFKRNRSVGAASLRLACSATPISTPSAKIKPNARACARRGQQLRPVATTAIVPGPGMTAPPAADKPPQPATPSAMPLRICISPLPDGASVRLQILPAIFCFGEIPLPHAAGYLSAVAGGAPDYAAMLLGPDGGLLSSESSAFVNDFPQAASPSTPRDTHIMNAVSLDADIAVKLVTRPRGTTPLKPDTPKDQNKGTKKHNVAKERKHGGGPGSFLHRLFSGFRQSRGGGGGGSNGRHADRNQDQLLARTARELGSELLMASTATAAADVATATHGIPLIAGYIKTASPGGAVSNLATGASLSARGLDDAVLAAQRLSTEIFQNVLQMSAGKSAAVPIDGGVSEAKVGLRSPRDTAFSAAEARTPQRDQVGVTALGGGRSRQETPSDELDMSPTSSRRQSPGGVALSLLVDLATAGVTAESSVQEPPLAATEAVKGGIPGVSIVAKGSSACGAKEELQLTLSTEALAVDLGGLPMPELEQCESPVAASSPIADLINDCSGVKTDPIQPRVREPREPVATPPTLPLPKVDADEPLPLMETSSSAAGMSPRTVSKRAYGTVARLVKKLAPNFRDTPGMSVSSSSSLQATATVAVTPGVASISEGVTSAADIVGMAAAGSPQEQQSSEVLTAVEGACVRSVTESAVDRKDTQDIQLVEQEVEMSPEHETDRLLRAMDSAEHAASATACEREGPAAAQEEGAAVEPSEPAGLVLFVFGQEQARSAKFGANRSRSASSKATAATAVAMAGAAPLMTSGNEDAAAAGRKRKAGDEILPIAKVPVVAERSGSSNISQEGLPTAPQQSPLQLSALHDAAAAVTPSLADELTETAPTAVALAEVAPVTTSTTCLAADATEILHPSPPAAAPATGGPPAAAEVAADAQCPNSAPAVEPDLGAPRSSPSPRIAPVGQPRNDNARREVNAAAEGSESETERGINTRREELAAADTAADTNHSPGRAVKYQDTAVTDGGSKQAMPAAVVVGDTAESASAVGAEPQQSTQDVDAAVAASIESNDVTQAAREAGVLAEVQAAAGAKARPNVEMQGMVVREAAVAPGAATQQHADLPEAKLLEATKAQQLSTQDLSWTKVAKAAPTAGSGDGVGGVLAAGAGPEADNGSGDKMPAKKANCYKLERRNRGISNFFGCFRW